MNNPVTALVVETNYLIASAIEVPLTAKGFKVIVAVNDAEIQAAIATNVIQIAIIDFRLQHGGPDGLVARLEAAKVPYIFCTAATSAEVAEHFPGARVVEKPFGDDMLWSVVSQAVSGASPSGHGPPAEAQMPSR
jgi:DNA-binding NtrC family response regulator